ncbi:unnamed protein product, partial [Prorocentrum cordatum]
EDVAAIFPPASEQPEVDGLENAEAKGAREKKARPPAERKEWSTDVTTVMIRQLPRQFTQVMLFEELTRRGFGRLFDFLYLPFDTKKGSNVGYGFVNFLQPQHAELFRREFDGTYMDGVVYQQDKLIHVHPASVQGYEANHEYFSQTRSLQRLDPRYSPIFLPGGFRDSVADRCEPGAPRPEGPGRRAPRPPPTQGAAAPPPPPFRAVARVGRCPGRGAAARGGPHRHGPLPGSCPRAAVAAPSRPAPAERRRRALHAERSPEGRLGAALSAACAPAVPLPASPAPLLLLLL